MAAVVNSAGGDEALAVGGAGKPTLHYASPTTPAAEDQNLWMIGQTAPPQARTCHPLVRAGMIGVGVVFLIAVMVLFVNSLILS